MANVLRDDKRQQVEALCRLGWTLRRIEREAGVRRETASAYLKAARTKVTALLLARDPAFDLQATPNGKLAFIRLVGVEGPLRERALQVGVAY